ncbi:ATP-dependent zinc metalloprotease FtsH [Mycoplasma sp. NEAQ87857]|uniref:ATP-dependent zinc metalloprotease FtsH n=1 Tax=Mycoplasma sp. NEAQ87857 TaxID=2683967 RepID=UPI001316B1E4|nr:ATP-dependent zinc metalloprotease FtsH [Mycoplasma sp. NEAQ87857]QGZ97997.1 ATP-dependent zinc metalloprotease FtsH [Mycoplasma sp. NEAQ87857]
MNKKRKPWKIVLTSVLLALLLVFLVYWLVNRYTGPQTIDLSKFQSQLNQILLPENSGLKQKEFEITNLNINDFQNTVSYTFKNQNYVLGANSRILQEVFLTNGKSIWDFLTNGQHAEIIKGFSIAKAPVTPWWSYLLGFLPTIIVVAMILYVIKMQMNAMNGNGAFGDRSPAQLIKSDKKFSDVAGNKEPIEEIKEIVDYLKNPEKYKVSGARMPRGILLGGPPGTGKTLLAKATAGEANVPFYFVSASNFVELFVGMGAKRVRQVIAEARKHSPAIVFIDELDAIGRTRGSGIGGGHDEREQTLNQLLVEMDGIKENSGLLFVAATNRTDVLDPALTRPGRFDRVITVGLPDVKEREEILKLHAKGKRFEPNVDFARVARRTPGFSGAQLENVINEAVLLSVRENKDLISLDIIDEAIDRVMAGPAKKSRTITQEELTLVAYHEAGHAVVGIKVPGGNKVQKITIIPRGQAGGYNLMMPENEKYNYTKEELLASIASFMGGRAAEEIIYGESKITTGASDDINKATTIARRMVTEFGMSDLGPIKYMDESGSPFLGKTLATSSSISNQISHEIDLEVRKIILEAKSIATKTISENKELLELIKTLLLEKETIIAEEIEYIAKHLELPPKKEEEKIEEKVEYDIDKLIQETDNIIPEENDHKDNE